VIVYHWVKTGIYSFDRAENWVHMNSSIGVFQQALAAVAVAVGGVAVS